MMTQQDDELTIENIFNEIAPPINENVKQNILSSTTEKPKTTERSTTVDSSTRTTENSLKTTTVASSTTTTVDSSLEQTSVTKSGDYLTKSYIWPWP